MQRSNAPNGHRPLPCQAAALHLDRPGTQKPHARILGAGPHHWGRSEIRNSKSETKYGKITKRRPTGASGKSEIRSTKSEPAGWVACKRPYKLQNVAVAVQLRGDNHPWYSEKYFYAHNAGRG